MVLVAVAALAMPASAAQTPKFSSIHEPAPPSAYTAEFFASRVKELTGGEVAVQVYHSRQLGDARDNVENVRNGSIAFTSVSISNLSQVLPVMDVWSLPYIFKSDDHYWYVLNHPKAADFMKRLEPQGIKTITWITSGARNLFTQKPVKTPADMKGMKIRVMASPVMINTMKSLGASGVPVAWGELYTALQTGVVDGAENNHPALISMKFYGLITPPVGTSLFVGCRLAGLRITAVIRPLAPLLAILLVVLALVTYWPPLTLWLPRPFGFIA